MYGTPHSSQPVDVDVDVHDDGAATGGTLVVGLSAPGLAGLTAVDYLVDALDLTESGHVTVDGLPAIAPFSDGRPRHHTRLYARDGVDVSVLVGELFVPPFVGEAFVDAVMDWTTDQGVDEIVLLSGVPLPHGPDEHRTYFVATDDYRENRLGDGTLPAMGSGFLDGVGAGLVQRGLDASPGVCVFVTPVHDQVPDAEAAVRLVETVADVYDLPVDAAPLAAFAAEVQQYYAGLAERLAEADERDLPEDRMYM